MAWVQRPLLKACGGAAGRREMSAAATKADVIIVGSGIMGLNIAFQIKKRDPTLAVTVLEQAADLGFGSSGYSTGFQRIFYTFDTTMQFAVTGTQAYKEWQAYLQDDTAEASFTETGALWMIGKSKQDNVAMQNRLANFHVTSDVLDEADFRKRFPMMNPEPFPKFDADFNEVAQNLGPFSALFEQGSGHIDASTCLADLARVVKRQNVQLRFKAKVDSVITKDNRKGDGAEVQGVKLADGSEISCPVVVNAAGPWFNKLNDSLGVKLSTTALPVRIQVAHKCIDGEYLNMPFTADNWGPSGIYFMPRKANNQLVFGSVDHRFESEIVDPDKYNRGLDPDFKQEYLNALFHRLPGLPQNGAIVGFSSMYTVNQEDVHPMIGETKAKGFWACNGFSGHGFKLAPAVGSMLAQQITGKWLKGELGESDIPHAFMGPYREPLVGKAKGVFA